MNLASNLVGGGLVSEFDFQTYKSRYVLLKTGLEHLTTSVAELQKNLDQMKAAAGTEVKTNNSEDLRNLIANLEQRRSELEQMSSTAVVLTAPIDGIVTWIH